MPRFAFFLLLAASAALAQDTREKTLDNGLRVLVRPMPGAPLVTVLTMYRVGSANEPAGQTGITHLCEHMLFKGSAKFPEGETNRLADRVGGYVNGMTNVDEITFFHVVPKERLLDFLDRHADHMENATFDPEEFRKEMVVVRSEMEGDENNPAWLLERAVFAAAFEVHGLHHPVIGWRADVEAVTPEQVKAWYRAHFRPNNAVVVVVGDVDADAAVAEIEKRFGGLKPGAAPFEPPPEPPQQGERRLTVRAPAAAALLHMAWHNAPTGHPDSFALEVLQEALGAGKRARLFRALVDSGLASDFTVNNYWSKYPTLFNVQATVAPGKSPADVEAAVDREIERARTEAMPADELARCVRQLARKRAFALDSTQEVAQAMADFEAFSSWRYGLGFAEEVAKVTPERILAAAKKYLGRDNRTVGALLPGDRADSPDLTAVAVDRAPKLGAAAAARPGAARPPAEFRLANGVRVLFWENPSSPTVAIQARWPGGAGREKGKSGLAMLAAEMLHAGTRSHDKAAFAELLEARGATIEHEVRSEYADAKTSGLAEDFETLAGLLAEFLREPAWPEAPFAVARGRVAARLADLRDDPEQMGLRALRGAIFPPGHPSWAAPLDDAIAAAKSLTLADAKAFHEAACRPRALVVGISGALDEKDVRRVAEAAFGAWKLDGDVPALDFPAPAPRPADPRLAVVLPDKSETFGAVGLPCALPRNSPDFPAFDVVNHILGAASVFSSRLGLRIRVENGLAYDTRSSLLWTTGNGWFWAQFGCNPANAGKAMELLQAELKRLRDDGVTDDEVRDAVSYLVGAYARWTETSEDKAGELLDLAWFGLGVDEPSKRADAYRAVTKEQANEVARKYLDLDRAVSVMAGTEDGGK